MISLGYGYSAAGGDLNTEVPSIVYPIYVAYLSDTTKDTLVPDLSDHSPLKQVMGFHLSLDFHQIRLSNFMTGFHIAFLNQKDIFRNFTFDWRFGYEIPLITDRVWLPLGAGASVGRYTYEIEYIPALRSFLEQEPILQDDATTSNSIPAVNFGFVGFTGLSVRIYKLFGVNVQAGYRYHFPVETWKGSYTEKKFEWEDEDGDGDYWETYEEETEFELDQKYLPLKDVLLNGLDIRAGVYVAF